MRARITPATFLRRLALLLLFNGGIAVVLALPAGRPLMEQMVYAQAIGLSIWLLIDFGRLLLKPDPRTGWPHGPRGVALVVVSIAAGFVLGTTVGDAWAGRSTWALWTANPRRLAGYVAVGALFGTVGSLFFYARGQLELAVRDAGVGLDGASATTASTGFGLQQVRERLQTPFGERAALKVAQANDDEGGTLAQIRLPWPAGAALGQEHDEGRNRHG